MTWRVGIWANAHFRLKLEGVFFLFVCKMTQKMGACMHAILVAKIYFILSNVFFADNWLKFYINI